jgi:hypothetical protein
VPGSFTFTTPATAPVAGITGHGLTFTPIDSANYGLVSGTVDVTVYPAVLTVTAAALSKSSGAADPALTYTVAGLVNGDTLAVISGTLSRAAGEGAGTYAINQGSLSAGSNYTIAYSPANLTIGEAGGGAAAVPALGMWGLMLAAAGLGGIMVRRRSPLQ